MKETFYFRKLGGWTFPMEVTINNDRHRMNFLLCMERKKFIQVTEAEYQKENSTRSKYASMCYKKY